MTVSDEAVEAAGLKFRKKPVVIEAAKIPALFDIEGRMAFEAWANPLKKGRTLRWVGEGISVETLEGVMRAPPGDWLICGVQGELYPCAADIFAATYEPAAPHMLPAPEGVSEAEKRGAWLNRSDEEWDALFDAISTVNGFSVGRVLTDADVAALHLVQKCEGDDEEAATDAYSRGHEDGLRKRGGDELVALTKRADDALIEKHTERTMRRLAESRADRAEFLLALALECARSKAAREAAMFDLADAAEARAQAAEAKVKEAGETLRPFLALARAVTVDGSPDFVNWAREAKDWVVALSFAGHSISLGDLRVLAALRWTETQGEGE